MCGRAGGLGGHPGRARGAWGSFGQVSSPLVASKASHAGSSLSLHMLHKIVGLTAWPAVHCHLCSNSTSIPDGKLCGPVLGASAYRASAVPESRHQGMGAVYGLLVLSATSPHMPQRPPGLQEIPGCLVADNVAASASVVCWQRACPLRAAGTARPCRSSLAAPWRCAWASPPACTAWARSA